MLVFFLLILLQSAAGRGISAYAQQTDEERTVRIAYPSQKRITDIDEDGQMFGYTYDYLLEVAQYTGWNYEFVQVEGTEGDQISTLMEMVQNGEVDLMGALMYNSAMDELYDFSGYSYGNFETVLQVSNDISNNVVIDASKNQLLRIALVSKNGRMAEDLKAYCQMNLITPVFLECVTEEEMMQAVRDGRADAFLNTSMNYVEGAKTVAGFSPRQFYFVTAEGDPSGLMGELKQAMAKIHEIDPYFQTALFERYFQSDAYSCIFSEEEKEYLEQAGEIRVGILTNRPPYQYKDENGEIRGIGISVLSHIAEITGLTFSYVEAQSHDELFALSAAGEVDILAGVPRDYVLSEQHGYSMVRPYATSQYVMLIHDRNGAGKIKGKRLALSDISTYEGYFVGNPVRFETVEDCVFAVKNGDADYTYVDAYTAQYYVNIYGFEQLKMVYQSHEPGGMCFALLKPLQKELYSILNKVILSLSEEEVAGIVYSNTILQQRHDISYFFRRYPLETGLIIAAVFMTAFLILIIFYFQRVRSAKNMTLQLQRHMQLFAVSNEAIFEYNYRTKKIMFNIPDDQGHSEKLFHFDFTKNSLDENEKRSCDNLLRLLNNSEQNVFEECLLGRDDKWHWYRVILERVKDDAGHMIYSIGRLYKIDEERRERDRLLARAQRDSLTQLYNVESCHERISQLLTELAQEERGALLLFDIDYFKDVNDRCGHMRGDEILCEVADILRENFQGENIIGRQGGDEFMVYLKSIDGNEALEDKCAKICDSIRHVVIDEGRMLSISMGVAFSSAHMKFETLYQNADQALYAAKRAGRDGFQIFRQHSSADEKSAL